jgi:hypothetical protein
MRSIVVTASCTVAKVKYLIEPSPSQHLPFLNHRYNYNLSAPFSITTTLRHQSTRHSCQLRRYLPTTTQPCLPFQSTSTSPSHRANLKASLHRPPAQQPPPLTGHHPPTHQRNPQHHPSQAQLPSRNQHPHAPPKAHKMPSRLLPNQAPCPLPQPSEQAKAALSPAP